MKTIKHTGFYHEIFVGVPDTANEKILSDRSAYVAPEYLNDDDSLPNATNLDLWHLINLTHPNEVGVQVSRAAVISEFGKRGLSVNDGLGLPVQREYPYVNRYTGYQTVLPLSLVLEEKTICEMDWWAVHEHYHPVPDLHVALEQIEYLIRLEGLKPKAPKTALYDHSGKYASAYTLSRLYASADVLQEYLDKYGVPLVQQPSNTYFSPFNPLLW